jgi:uncharacterized protein
MKIVVAGATGFIGRPLVRQLCQDCHEVTVISRQVREILEGVVCLAWSDENAWQKAVADADAVVNLSGASVAEQRWNTAVKAELRSSRVTPTQRLISARPKVLIQASAVGFYGETGDAIITEKSPSGSDFLANLCRAWEGAAWPGENHGTRVVLLRIGQVLGNGGGALASFLNPPMLPFSPFRVGLGGPLGSGKQWMPWIHLDDVVGLIIDAIQNVAYRGAVNATAPNPVTNKEFAQALGEILGKPAGLAVPAPALKLLLGEFADYLLMSQRVVPSEALRIGYVFQYPNLTEALDNLLRQGDILAPK